MEFSFEYPSFLVGLVLFGADLALIWWVCAKVVVLVCRHQQAPNGGYVLLLGLMGKGSLIMAMYVSLGVMGLSGVNFALGAFSSLLLGFGFIVALEKSKASRD